MWDVANASGRMANSKSLHDAGWDDLMTVVVKKQKGGDIRRVQVWYSIPIQEYLLINY